MYMNILYVIMPRSLCLFFLLEVTLEEQNAALQQRLAELESDMLQFESNFLDHIHRVA